MPINGLPTFTAGILTAAQLNAIVTALEAKFAGQLASGDITWPLVAGGNLDMSNYQILNVSQFWGQYNVADRASGTSFQDVLDALSTAGGGDALIPGNHTETIPAAGITVPANVNIVGAGNSSILEMDASASATMVTLSNDNSSLRNLRCVGRSSQNEIAVLVTSADGARLSGVTFDTHNAAPYVQVAGSSTNTSISQCTFNGGGDGTVQVMLSLVSADNTRIIGNTFEEWSSTAVGITPAVGQPVSNTIVADNSFRRTASASTGMGADAFVVDFNNTGNSTASEGFIFANNSIGGGGDDVRGVRVAGTNTVGVIIDNNYIETTAIKVAVIIYGGVQGAVISNNTIIAGAGDGVVIGSNQGTEVVAGSRTVSSVLNIAITGNNITSDEATLVLAMSTNTTGVRGTVTGNRLSSASTHVMQVWNITGATTPTYLVINGNNCNVGVSTTLKGFASFSDMGATNDGDIGAAAFDTWFTMVGNTIPNSDPLVDYNDGTNQCIVQDNNV